MNNNQIENFLFFNPALFISIIIFKNALGRSDAGHIRYFGFNYFLIIVCLLNIILNSYFYKEKLNKYFLLVPIIMFSLTLFLLNKSNSSFKKYYKL